MSAANKSGKGWPRRPERVLHALCERDGLTAPEWVHRHRLDPGIVLFGVPLDSPFGDTIRRRAPRVCTEHGIWFGADMLDA